jgi:hypothetical protein
MELDVVVAEREELLLVSLFNCAEDSQNDFRRALHESSNPLEVVATPPGSRGLIERIL